MPTTPAAKSRHPLTLPTDNLPTVPDKSFMLDSNIIGLPRICNFSANAFTLQECSEGQSRTEWAVNKPPFLYSHTPFNFCPNPPPPLLPPSSPPPPHPSSLPPSRAHSPRMLVVLTVLQLPWILEALTLKPMDDTLQWRRQKKRSEDNPTLPSPLWIVEHTWVHITCNMWVPGTAWKSSFAQDLC